jgi:hypothetical protein
LILHPWSREADSEAYLGLCSAVNFGVGFFVSVSDEDESQEVLEDWIVANFRVQCSQHAVLIDHTVAWCGRVRFK